MQNPNHTFEALAQTLREMNPEPVRVFSFLDAGVAAVSQIAFRTDGTSRAGTASVAAEKDVYEGPISHVSRSTWSGLEVLGDSVGINQSTAGIVEGFRLYSRLGDDYVAVEVDAMPDGEQGYWTGGIVDILAGEHELSGNADVFAMSLFARVFAFSGKVITEHYIYYENDDVAYIYLDGIYNISTGDVVVVEADGKIMACKVSLSLIHTIETIGNGAIPVTLISIDAASIIGKPDLPKSARIWFDAKKAGTLERIPTKTVKKGDFLNKAVPVTLPQDTLLPAQDTFILIQDAEDKVVRAKGGGQQPGDTPQILITELLQEFADDEELVKPITFLWGLTKVTRGQSVYRELIGSGDAMSRWQSFRLAKSPLTYVADPSAPGGRRPEIDVYVNGLKWRRAQSFYKATPRDEIYVVRHDAEHNTFIQFGDGELGKRLPTGKNNVVATYRHGVGGNVEANTITDLFRPIPGVESVTNPLPATGGEDPPTEKEAREKAIQSTRVLGRLVSLPDFEVEAARYGGVIRARARWVWDEAGEDAIVRVWIICTDDGDPSADLRTYLMGMAEPGVRVQVCLASKYTGALELELELDPNYLPEEVYAAVDARLFDEFDGLLVPRNVPIGGAFHRSELYGAIHEIPGVLHVAGVFVDGVAMDDYITLGEGQYLAIAYPETV